MRSKDLYRGKNPTSIEEDGCFPPNRCDINHAYLAHRTEQTEVEHTKLYPDYPRQVEEETFKIIYRCREDGWSM